MNDSLNAQLKDTVRYLGATLGETIEAELGSEWLQKIEQIRQDGRDSYAGETESTQRLTDLFASLDNRSLLTIGRAFAQFLNLANIAEQEFNSANQRDESLAVSLEKIKSLGADREKVLAAVKNLNIDLVLTAHPTEVTRRTLIHKHRQLASQLQELHTTNITEHNEKRVKTRIAGLISQAWHTEEIRSVRPTPVDEARWGFSVIETSLWEAVPEFLRELDEYLQSQFDISLPLDAKTVQFSSWMGGDRDGNPFVTSTVTEEVLRRARRRAAKLFSLDLDNLYIELSMNDCNEQLRELVGDAKEPYRAALKAVRNKLELTRDGQIPVEEWVASNDELLHPLMACYDSLHDCGMQVIAEGALKDTIRRVHSFGVNLLKLDIRQDSERHADVFSELTRYLGIGDYGQWSEEDKQAFLLRELSSKRPLIPHS
ncbi:MAG: phosphoenolpyruvate carboxylase, partial [Glaciecola sp.]